MFCEHAVALRQQFFLGGELRPVKAPIRMLRQFFITFIGVVDGMEKCFRVAGMDRYRNPQPTALLPYRVEARIVDRDQLSGFVTNGQPQIL